MDIKYFSTPILLIVWRRPKETIKVIDSIRKIKPNKLFISCDGPRLGNQEEELKVKRTQEVCKESINWDCEVKWQISETNLGCKIGVTRAINWFFNNVKEGIILEDDIVAHPDFFAFCENLLEKYRMDKRVWCISGSNNQDNIPRGESSYYFGKIPLIWGWATWRNRWDEYDIDMKYWPHIKSSNMLSNIFEDQAEKEYWINIWDNFYKNGKPDTWDYSWVLTCLINNGLIAIPNKNLINNIGFNCDATHTTWEKQSTSIMKSIGDKIIHPKILVCNKKAEKYQFNFYFGGYSTRLKNNLIMRIKNKLKRILKFKIKTSKL